MTFPTGALAVMLLGRWALFGPSLRWPEADSGAPWQDPLFPDICEAACASSGASRSPADASVSEAQGDFERSGAFGEKQGLERSAFQMEPKAPSGRHFGACKQVPNSPGEHLLHWVNLEIRRGWTQNNPSDDSASQTGISRQQQFPQLCLKSFKFCLRP